MKEIIKVLLQEGIDEVMINRVLDLIEEEYEVIDEYINKERKEKIDTVSALRRKNTDNAPEGPEKKLAKEKEARNIELTDNYYEKHGSDLQKAHHRGYSKNAKEKKALLKAGLVLKESPITGHHHIMPYA